MFVQACITISCLTGMVSNPMADNLLAPLDVDAVTATVHDFQHNLYYGIFNEMLLEAMTRTQEYAPLVRREFVRRFETYTWASNMEKVRHFDPDNQKGHQITMSMYRQVFLASLQCLSLLIPSNKHATMCVCMPS